MPGSPSNPPSPTEVYRFVQSLEQEIKRAASLLKPELRSRCLAQPAFRAALDVWMTGAPLRSARGDRRPGGRLERAAELALCLLANRLIFYEALRGEYDLEPLAWRCAASARELAARLRELFAAASAAAPHLRGAFQDNGEKSPLSALEIGCISDRALPAIESVIKRIAEFDFARRGWSAAAAAFGRGSYADNYTPALLARFVCAFCISGARDLVLDPTCGDGQFLIGALERKLSLDPGAARRELVADLFGIEISPAAAALAALRLSAAALGQAAAVENADFFEAFPGSRLPELIDVIIGNPPYLRQELIDAKRRMKNAILVDAVRHGTPFVNISGRSDIYVYFWLHCLPFLREGGRLGFVTSNSWLDSSYGAAVQRFLLENFKILAVVESGAERWFHEPAVNTAVALLERESDPAGRDQNMVRFVQLRQQLDEIAGSGFDQLASAIKAGSAPPHRIYSIRQAELRGEGLRQTVYVGSKWGKYLRAPDIFFRLLERSRARLCRLEEIAAAAFGIKTGANDFFYLKDLTESIDGGRLKRELEVRGAYEARRLSREELRMVRDGRGQLHIIEGRFLRPVLRSPRDAPAPLVDARRLSWRLFCAVGSKRDLKGTFALKYISHGERQGYHLRPSLAARRRWWELSELRPSRLLWRKSTYAVHSHFFSAEEIYADQRLHLIRPRPDVDPCLIAAILNSSVSALMLELCGRAVLGEGALDTAVYEVSQHNLLDPRKLAQEEAARIKDAFARLAARSTLPVWQELKMPDRHLLDKAVLSALGFAGDELQTVAAQVAQAVAELASQRLKRTRHGQPRAAAAALAADLWPELDRQGLRAFPEDFLTGREVCEHFDLRGDQPQFEDGLFQGAVIRCGTRRWELGAPARARFLKAAARRHPWGPIPVPKQPAVCAALLEEYHGYNDRLDARLAALTGTIEDEAARARVRRELMRMIEAYLKSGARS